MVGVACNAVKPSREKPPIQRIENPDSDAESKAGDVDNVPFMPRM